MKRYMFLAALLMAQLQLTAQTFNPTVEVTNAYEGKLMEVHKKALQMNVPDSLLKFDWDFDYSVFENPYQGSYDFSPYAMNMTPDPVPFAGTNLYLRAGAGYSFHPEAVVAWNPYLDGKFQLGIRDDFSGYAGAYHTYEYGNGGLLSRNGAKNGSDFYNGLSLNSRYDAGKVVLSLNAGYDVISSDYDVFSNKWNSIAVDAGVSSSSTGKIAYDGSLHFLRGSGMSLTQTTVDAAASMKAFMGKGMYAGADAEFESEGFNDVAGGNITFVRLAPVFGLDGEWGSVRASAVVTVSGKNYTPAPDYNKGQLLYPQLYADLKLFDEAAKFYTSFGSGSKVDTYNDLIAANHFIDPCLRSFGTLCFDNVVTPYDIEAGVKGRVSSRLQYKVGAGYYRKNNALAEQMIEPSILLPGCSGFLFDRVDAMVFHADAELSWKSEGFTADGRISYKDWKALNGFAPLAPSALTGAFSAMYDWHSRIFAGASIEFASARTGKLLDRNTGAATTDVKVPGWADLGLFAEYRFSSMISVWAKGCNLLGADIQRNLLYTEKGAYFTAGICLNF